METQYFKTINSVIFVVTFFVSFINICLPEALLCIYLAMVFPVNIEYEYCVIFCFTTTLAILFPTHRISSSVLL